MYSLGPSEYYIDLAMPFGKANSSKIFCRWASLWFKSCITRFNWEFNANAVLGSYVDDAFGGDVSYATAKELIEYVTAAGDRHQTFVNVAKSEGPSTSMVILGLLYCSELQICSLAPKKVRKYAEQMVSLLRQGWATSKDLERMVGRLEFAAWVEPFGRPLLSFLSAYITPDYPRAILPLTEMMRICLRVWHLLISRNRGLHFGFILNYLPTKRPPIFVDASLSGGIGGYFGLLYFSLSIEQLKPWLVACDGWESFPRVDIAWLELLAACVALYTFTRHVTQRILTLFSDNTNVVAWLTRRRAPDPFVCAVVAAMERVKYHNILKISTRYIPSAQNTAADFLSRGHVPDYLYRHGTRRTPPMRAICANLHLNNIEKLWATTINRARLPTQV